MPSPFTHGLLPMACALSSARASVGRLSPAQWRALAIVGFLLGNSPDIDLIPAALWPANYHMFHRYAGHNGFALTLWIYLGVKALRRWVGPEFSGKTGWIFSAALVLSHVLLDGSAEVVPGTGHRAGVPILWPLSNWEFLTPFELFGGYRLLPASHPLLAFLTTPAFWQNFLGREIVCTALIATLWFVATKLLHRRQRAVPLKTEKSIDEKLPLAG